jgi:hypothetical protein
MVHKKTHFNKSDSNKLLKTMHLGCQGRQAESEDVPAVTEIFFVAAFVELKIQNRAHLLSPKAVFSN